MFAAVKPHLTPAHLDLLLLLLLLLLIQCCCAALLLLSQCLAKTAQK
jgi:hypothetical protein